LHEIVRRRGFGIGIGYVEVGALICSDLVLIILVIFPLLPALRTCAPRAAPLALLLALLLLPLGGSLQPLLLLLFGTLPLALLEFGNLLGFLGVQINLLQAEKLPPALTSASRGIFQK
jgi:hypothetical protein